LALVLIIWARPWQKATPIPTDSFPLSAVASSPFLNTHSDVRYVGSAACLACHEDHAASFRGTGMGRSMAAVDPAGEPPDGIVDHALSKRRYQVCRKDGALWLREFLLTDGKADVLLEEHPAKYVVGSGANSRSYLIETDGFLVEAPLTWYASRQAWGMSPGYDKATQLGFMRSIGEGCLFCHAGQAHVADRSLNRMHITEDAIGCERCHGPGALHVERHRSAPPAGQRPTGMIDYSIVRPTRLSRELSEAVCEQCHLPAATAVPARGRKLSDFRPGLRLQDFWHVYQQGGTDGEMAVVGHVEQLHASRCYQASSSLTCLTCHNPHEEPAPEDRAAHYNAVCQSCHRPERCTVAVAVRARESPGNNCVQCHMPRGDTDIPHHTFAHHRIGIHQAKGAPGGGEPDRDAELRPFLQLFDLGELDRQRSLGLAYLALSQRETDPARTGRDQHKALELLSGVRQAGLRDPDVEAALAQLSFDLQVGDPLAHAESALAHADLAGQSRCDALLVLAREQGGEGDHEKAKAALLELTRLRRNPVDWLYLASCLKALGDERGSTEALETATRINPRLWNVHRFLAEFYRQQGDAEKATFHQRRAEP
jgi:hypothetical protein